MIKLNQPEAQPGMQSLIRILVLDDDITFGKVMERYAKKMNIDLVFASTVQDFADTITQSSFDIVILDYYLDAYRGTEIAHAIPSIPVLLVSSKSDVLRSDEGIGSSVNKFVHKKYGAQRILNEAMMLVHASTGNDLRVAS